MAFESLTERLQNVVFKNSCKRGENIWSWCPGSNQRDCLALLEADVALPVVKDLPRRFVNVQSDTRSLIPLNPAQQIIKIVDEKGFRFRYGRNYQVTKNSTIIMMVGLQGL